MLSRLISNKFRFYLILISALFISFGIQNSGTDSTQNVNHSPIPSGKFTAFKPVFFQPPQIDWNQSVNVLHSNDHIRFPLSFSGNDEYLLVINNLNRSPQQSNTIQLSAKWDPQKQAPSDCCFQNTSPFHKLISVNNSPSIAQQAESAIHWKSNRQQDTELKPAKNERSFYLFVTDGNLSDKNQYTCIKGRLIQHSPRVAIYLDDQQNEKELAAGLVTDIIEMLESRVLDQITSQCGPIRDIDQNGRFTVLLSPWLSKLQGGKTSINGFVRPSDFRKTVPKPFSNHGDMLYLNSAIRPGQELLDLLSHEVTHAAVTSTRTALSHPNAGTLLDEEDWLNEGIAHLMEPGDTNRDYRISEFYHSPESYPLIVPDYYRAQLWRNHGCRGAVNLFLKWCNQIESKQSFPGRFTYHPQTGIKKIEQLTSTPFSELFRQWSLHLVKPSLAMTTQGIPDSHLTEVQCGKFLTTGPALRSWNFQQNQQTSLNIASSASGFLLLKSDNTDIAKNPTRTAQIEINGFPGMQLTLLKLPKGRDQLSLSASDTGHDLVESRLRESVEVRIHCIHPAHSEVESISLELSGAYLSRTERQPRQFLARALESSLTLNQETLEAALTRTQDENGKRTTEFLMRIPQNYLKKHPLPASMTFKAIIKTENQQWIAGQCNLELPRKPVQRLVEVSAQADTK